MDKIRILLVDDQILLREGLKTIINLQEDLQVIEEADNGKAAVELMGKIEVDVILMDIRMPQVNGVEATRIIKENFPDVHIIILTTFDDDEYIIDALCNGAAGYLLKDIDAQHLIQSIRDVNSGQLMLPSKVAAKLAVRIAGKPTKLKNDEPRHEPINSYTLTDREKEIGSLLAQGLSNSQIARKLYLSEGTVKNYISELYQKLGTSNRTKAGLIIQQILQ